MVCIITRKDRLDCCNAALAMTTKCREATKERSGCWARITRKEKLSYFNPSANVRASVSTRSFISSPA